MLESGDWLVPRRASRTDDGPFLEKPPLKFWIVAAADPRRLAAGTTSSACGSGTRLFGAVVVRLRLPDRRLAPRIRSAALIASCCCSPTRRCSSATDCAATTWTARSSSRTAAASTTTFAGRGRSRSNVRTFVDGRANDERPDSRLRRRPVFRAGIHDEVRRGSLPAGDSGTDRAARPGASARPGARLADLGARRRIRGRADRAVVRVRVGPVRQRFSGRRSSACTFTSGSRRRSIRAPASLALLSRPDVRFLGDRRPDPGRWGVAR